MSKHVEIRRMWVNQPSTYQQYHKLHGINVLAEYHDGELVRVWHVSGPIVHQQMDNLALSKGWRTNHIG